MIENNQSYQVSKELAQWNQAQAISLQLHQSIPIDYLEKSPDIKGLIINHQLGTGKTLLSIGFAERNPNCKVIILAPNFLHGHWWSELDKYGVKNKQRYRFIGHHKAQELMQEALSNTIVIIDEAHRFIQSLRAQSSVSHTHLYFKIRKSYRLLALTATPIYSDMFDLIYLVNLVSQKDIFPFNHEQFRLSFSKLDPLNAYWRGHLINSWWASIAVGMLLSGWLGLPPFFGLSAIYVPLVSPNLLPIQAFPGRIYDIIKMKGII